MQENEEGGTVYKNETFLPFLNTVECGENEGARIKEPQKWTVGKKGG